MIHPYIVAYTSTHTLSLTYQKVFSGNASYYHKLTKNELDLISKLDPLMLENIVRKFSPQKKIRPKEYFYKYFDKTNFKEKIRPYIDQAISSFFEDIDPNTNQIYEADEINPAANLIQVQSEFTKVLFHFRKNENGTSYFITLKHGEERIPFMKQNGLLLSSKPARILVHQKIYKFYDFVDGSKIGVFLNKKFVHIKPENQKTYYTKFIRPLLETAPVQAQGFTINTIKENAKSQLSLTKHNEIYGFNMSIIYDSHTFLYQPNKLFHVHLKWEKNEPIFTKFKRSVIWESNKANTLETFGLIHQQDAFFRGAETTITSCISWLRDHYTELTKNNFIISKELSEEYNFDKPQLNYTIADQIDWFDLKIMVIIGNFEVPFSKIVAEMKKGNHELRLANGQIFIFPSEWFAIGKSLFSSSSKNNQYQIKKYELSVLNHIQSDEIKNHLNSVVEIKAEKPHKAFKGMLRPYQVDGLSWLMFLKNNRFGGILADDMGLGKTIQTLAFIQKIKHSLTASSPHPFLLITPTSLLYNWANECAKFTPDVKVHIHAGNKRHQTLGAYKNTDLIITSYGLIRNDSSLFQEVHFEVVILDESQNIKNYSAKTTQCINILQAKCRIALTGTPIENTIKDLWSQMNFLNKGLLGSLTHFTNTFAKPIEKEDDQQQVNKLKQMIKPFLLRRTKDEVAKDLPNLQEKILYCEMSEEQEKHYEKIKSMYRNQLLDIVQKEGIKSSKLSILQGLSKLRQISNHPILSDTSYAHNSGKHDILLDKIRTGIQDGHKILVFSQFVSYLELIEKTIKKESLTYYKLTGATSKEKREQYVQAFQKQSDSCVFLISLKAGGVGINLTAADYVFIADPWWNPAAEAQARDRSHRIGQTKTVFSYKFISRGTIEEKIIKLQNQKNKFSKDLIHIDNNILTNLKIKDLHFLLE